MTHIHEERKAKECSTETMPGCGSRVRLPSLGYSHLDKENHRVVVMGAARVGKSSIISQFLYDKFLARYRETVEELHCGEYELQDGVALTLEILDTSGAYQFPAMRALSISTADAFILVFALDDAESWEEVRRLRDQIVQVRGGAVPVVVVGNKDDVDAASRAVPQEVAGSVATLDWECGYIECSAKHNVRIVDVFKELLVQAKVRYNLSPAVRRRRQSLPNDTRGTGGVPKSRVVKQNSCTVA
ncbi:GTP-binding protein Rhes-like [Anabrus simplex]|uniref:GTP-binding protein Rhes-like n=1 Tax=Anabrus simplex TaxID=316456 RepID=UPI0035A28D50